MITARLEPVSKVGSCLGCSRDYFYVFNIVNAGGTFSVRLCVDCIKELNAAVETYEPPKVRKKRKVRE